MARVTKPANYKTAEALPILTDNDLWWRVTMLPASQSAAINQKPILVELMEKMSPPRKAISRVLGWEKTIATTKAVVEAADLILARVADYQLVVGEYGGEEVDG